MRSMIASGLAIPGRLATTDLRLDGGSLVGLIGPNGGGKTSLLRSIAGVEPSASGQVWIDDELLATTSIARRPRLIAFLPATREIPWPISARDVIALGLPVPDPMRVQELLEGLELQSLADRPVDRLSTGERARVLLARALAPRPRVLLLDEPCSNLEPYWALRIMELLRREADRGAAVCLSLHDLTLLPACDRALLVAAGALRADMAPGELLDTDEFAAVFRVRQSGRGWAINLAEDRRSLP